MDQVKFVEDGLKKILIGPFLNTLTHLCMQTFKLKLFHFILVIYGDFWALNLGQ